MIISLSWLKNHLSTKANLNQIVERLTKVGLEVENVKKPKNDLDDFVICKIVKSQKHPNADRLKLCLVDIGEKEPLDIICGAPNVTKNIKVPIAIPGTSIGNIKIKRDIIIIININITKLVCFCF